MQIKEPLMNFVNALAEYVKTQQNGSVVIMGDNDGWGKAVIEKSEIVSINYDIYRGMQVLPELVKLKEIRFMFRQSKQDEGNDGNAFTNAGSARISNEEFFTYFGLKVPDVNGSPATQPTVIDSAESNRPAKKHTLGSFRERILIIDDSVIARKAAAVPLIEYGYDISEAKDGFDALGKLDNEIPDLIILDLIMPGLDGYKVVDLLKKNDKFKNIPIIMVTSKDSLMDRVKGKMSPTDAYITKPFNEADLLKTVVNILKDN